MPGDTGFKASTVGSALDIALPAMLDPVGHQVETDDILNLAFPATHRASDELSAVLNESRPCLVEDLDNVSRWLLLALLNELGYGVVVV